MHYFRFTGAAALAAALSLILPAGADTAPGATVTGSTIVLGQYADQSGANAPTGASKYGLDAYLQTINAAGGIQGKKLQLISYDDGYKPAQTTQVVRKLVYQDQAFAIVGGIGTPTTAAVAPMLDDLGVPLVAMSTGSPIFYQPVRKYVFPAWPLYTTDGKTMGTFVKSHFPGKKTGVIYQDDGFGKPILAAVQSVLGPVETASYTPGQVDFSDALVKFKAAGGRGDRACRDRRPSRADSQSAAKTQLQPRTRPHEFSLRVQRHLQDDPDPRRHVLRRVPANTR